MKQALVRRKWSAKISETIQSFYNCNNKTVHYDCNFYLTKYISDLLKYLEYDQLPYYQLLPWAFKGH